MSVQEPHFPSSFSRPIPKTKEGSTAVTSGASMKYLFTLLLTALSIMPLQSAHASKDAFGVNYLAVFVGDHVALFYPATTLPDSDTVNFTSYNPAKVNCTQGEMMPISRQYKMLQKGECTEVRAIVTEGLLTMGSNSPKPGSITSDQTFCPGDIIPAGKLSLEVVKVYPSCIQDPDRGNRIYNELKQLVPLILLKDSAGRQYVTTAEDISALGNAYKNNLVEAWGQCSVSGLFAPTGDAKDCARKNAFSAVVKACTDLHGTPVLASRKFIGNMGTGSAGGNLSENSFFIKAQMTCNFKK